MLLGTLRLVIGKVETCDVLKIRETSCKCEDDDSAFIPWMKREIGAEADN